MSSHIITEAPLVLNEGNCNDTPHLNAPYDSESDNDKILTTINYELSCLKDKRYRSVKHDPADSRISPRAEIVQASFNGNPGYQTGPSCFSDFDLKSDPSLNNMCKISDNDTFSSSSSVSFQPNTKGVQLFNESIEEICSSSKVKYPSDNQTCAKSTSTRKSNTRASDIFLPLPVHLRDSRNVTWELESDFPLLTSDNPSVKVTEKKPSSLVSVAKSLLSEVPVTLNADSSFKSQKSPNASDIQRLYTDKDGYSANRTLVIENLPANIDEIGLKDFLLTFGSIEDLTLQRIGNTGSVAYVMMSPEVDMQWIIECLNGSYPFGDLSSGEIVCRLADRQGK